MDLERETPIDKQLGQDDDNESSSLLKNEERIGKNDQNYEEGANEGGKNRTNQTPRHQEASKAQNRDQEID